MRCLGVGLSCALAVVLLTGCAHGPGVSDVLANPQSSVHAEKQPVENNQAHICLLDPAAYAAEQPVQPTSASASDTAPAVELPETTYDFGKFGENGELVHKFNIRNVGNSVLNIKKVQPG